MKNFTLDDQWEAHFLALVKYKERVGNCSVPLRYIENKLLLGQWVKQQRQNKLSDERRRQAAEAAAAQLWTTYSQRQKSVLEQVLNYTSTSDLNGTNEGYWISGDNGAHACVVTEYRASRIEPVRNFDIRMFDVQGFRIGFSDYTYSGFNIGSIEIGDETNKQRFSRNNQLQDRLRDAWGLAVQQCPGRSAAPF